MPRMAPSGTSGQADGMRIPSAATPPRAGQRRAHAADAGAARGARRSGESAESSAKPPVGQAGGVDAGSIQAAGGAGRGGAGARPRGGADGAGGAAPAGQPRQQPPDGQGARAGPRLDLDLAYIMKDSEYVAKGQVVRPNGFDAYMRGRVSPRHLDAAGAKIIRDMLGHVVTSDFGISMLDEILSPSPSSRQAWRVGESLAECFLEDHEEALFPYPYSRDVKSDSASHAGADLSGYSLGGPNGKAMFLFGETKTSDEARRPPRVARSLGGQMDALCSPKARRALIRRLCIRAGERGDERLMALHGESMTSYQARKFRLVGVLIRGTGADRRDLVAAFNRVKAGRCAKRLDLISLYLPVPADSLGGML